jgi:predicted nucleic acid-binding protein
MNVYVETNFVLELVFQQEQCASCESILDFCEAGNADLIIPAYCLAEPHEKLFRQNKSRKELQRVLDDELRQLARSSSYNSRISSMRELASLLIQSNEEERQRFAAHRDRLLSVATIIPLTAEILSRAAIFEETYDLEPQDAIVFTSVVHHLEQQQSLASCFLNKNSRDFDNPDIGDVLRKHECRMIPRFDQGSAFITTRA